MNKSLTGEIGFIPSLLFFLSCIYILFNFFKTNPHTKHHPVYYIKVKELFALADPAQVKLLTGVLGQSERGALSLVPPV